MMRPAGVCCVASPPGHLDLFVVGFDNVVWTAAWTDGQQWTGWRQAASGDQVRPHQAADRRHRAGSGASGSVCGRVRQCGVDGGFGRWSTGRWRQLHAETKFDHEDTAESPFRAHRGIWICLWSGSTNAVCGRRLGLTGRTGAGGVSCMRRRSSTTPSSRLLLLRGLRGVSICLWSGSTMWCGRRLGLDGQDWGGVASAACGDEVRSRDTAGSCRFAGSGQSRSVCDRVRQRGLVCCVE